MDTVGVSPLICGQKSDWASSEDNTELKIDKGLKHSPYKPWNNSPLEKTPLAEQEIEPGTSWLVQNYVATKLTNWAMQIL